LSFIDRSDAGKQLALALEKYRGNDVVLLALPRGGVPVAVEVKFVGNWQLLSGGDGLPKWPAAPVR
jgi:hypothetical protein